MSKAVVIKMRDLTKGNMTKLLLSFALPVLLGNLIQQFYNIADIKIVGATLGVDALAGVGAASPIFSLIIGFLNGLTNGFSIIVSRFFGAYDYKNMKKALGMTVVIGIFTAVILTVVGTAFLYDLLIFLKTPDSILELSYDYAVVLILGMTCTLIYNMCANILRAIGDSRTPLLFLIIAVVLNIGFDLLFILVFKLGVMGASLATVVAQAISALCCLIYIYKYVHVLKLSREDFSFDKKILKDLLSSGVSMGLIHSVVSLGSVALQSAINDLGKETIAAHTAARKISELYMMPMSALCTSAATVSSQNFGAENFPRIRSGIYSAVLLSWVWGTFIIAVTYLFAPFMVELLASTENEFIIKTAVDYLKFNTPFYYILAILSVSRCAMQGMGRVVIPIFTSVIEFFGKLIVAFWLAPKLGYFGITLSEPSVWVVCAILLVVCLLLDKRLWGREAKA